MFQVIEKATGRWLGRLGPWRLIDWVFDTLDWTEILLCIMPGNFRAHSWARRLGSRPLHRQGVLPEPFGTQVDTWGQTREEWRAHCR